MMKKGIILSLATLLLLTSCTPRKSHIALESIALPEAAYTLALGETLNLQISYQPEDASNKSVSWETSNPEVATVTDGIVTAVGKGPVVITVTADDGELKATCEVNVIVPLRGVSIDINELRLTLGSSQQLNAATVPSDATDQTLLWTSSDSNVVEVNQEGLVTAVALGKADITVTSGDNLYSAVCKIEVMGISVTGVSLSITSAELPKGDKKQLTASLTPSNATNQGLTWTSSNTNVASVDASGLVTAVGPGSAVITVKTTDGGKTAQCNITVYNKASGNTHGNLNYEGRHAWYQGHIYFFKDGLSKQSDSMQGQQQLHTDDGEYINVVDGWIYYVHENDRHIYKIRTDGTGRQKIVSKSSSYLSVVDGWMYFKALTPPQSHDIYRCRLDGSDMQKISSHHGQELRVADGWVYYRNYNDNDALYRMRIDGSGKQKINSQWTGEMVISGGWIYFVQDELAYSKTIYRMKVDGTSKQQLGSSKGVSLHVVGNWVYYAGFSPISGTYSINRIRIDGSNIEYLDSGRNSKRFYILGDWILYSDSYSYKRMRLDGSGKTNVSH